MQPRSAPNRSAIIACAGDDALRGAPLLSLGPSALAAIGETPYDGTRMTGKSCAVASRDLLDFAVERRRQMLLNDPADLVAIVAVEPFGAPVGAFELIGEAKDQVAAAMIRERREMACDLARATLLSRSTHSLSLGDVD